MISFLLRLVPMLVIVCAVLISVIRAQPYDDGELRLVLGDGECWQGICIDVTTREDALRTLEANPWVGEIFQTTYNISWRWSGRQPGVLDASQDGLLSVTGDVVRQLRLITHVSFGDLWVTLDRPDDDSPPPLNGAPQPEKR